MTCRIYDYGRDSALLGFSFEGRAEQLALGATCSDKFMERFEALERGYAEGMRLRSIVANVAAQGSDSTWPKNFLDAAKRAVRGDS